MIPQYLTYVDLTDSPTTWKEHGTKQYRQFFR